MRSYLLPQQFHGAENVFADHVAFEVHAIVCAPLAKVRVRPGERDNLNLESRLLERRNRQADAVNRDRSAMYEIRREPGGITDRDPPEIRFGPDRFDRSRSIDMAKHHVAA